MIFSILAGATVKKITRVSFSASGEVKINLAQKFTLFNQNFLEIVSTTVILAREEHEV